MNYVFLDFETASELDLKVVGLDRYVKHPSTRVLMLAFAFNDGPVELWCPHLGPMPEKLKSILMDVKCVKVSWNVPFEFQVFQHVLKTPIPIEQWLDAMVLARHLSLPGKLEDAGPAIGLMHDQTKKAEGKRLIKKFSSPYHKGGEETLFGISEPLFHTWEDEPRDWALFGEYCKQDVVSERAIFYIAVQIKFPEKERRAWILDQKINERGIPVNRKFVENALALALKSKERLVHKLKELTALANPNSRPQFLGWAQQHGYPHLSLGKEFVRAALNPGTGIDAQLREALKLRQAASKTSYTKFEKLLNLLSDDDRLRHQFAFMGAARTGRWAGKDAQVQNMPRPTKEVELNYERALELIEKCPLPVTDAYIEMVEKEFASVIGMVTSCIRSVFQAPKGKKLVVCDLGSIENRVLGWLAGCDAIAQVFREGRDAYLDFAAKMYNLVYSSLIKVIEGTHKPKDKDAGEKRQIAKPGSLGCGYGLGPGVIRKCAVCGKELKSEQTACNLQNTEAYGNYPEKHHGVVYEAVIVEDQYGNKVKTGLMGYAENMGVVLTPEQAYLAWETFRKSYPEVVQLWKKYEKASFKVLETGRAVKVGSIIFSRRVRKDGSIILRIELPSGRGLHYLNARIQTETAYKKSNGEAYEKKTLIYDGIGHGVGKIGKGGKWGPVKTYGGKETENIDQGFSRDVLVEDLFLADDAGASIVMHTHDEIVCEEDDDPFTFGLEDLKKVMQTTPEWAPGLIIGAEGFESRIYRK